MSEDVTAQSWLVGFLLVVVLPGVVLLIQWGIRRRWPALAEGDHNEVVGFIIAVVGVIYAVLLAFVVLGSRSDTSADLSWLPASWLPASRLRARREPVAP